MCLCKCCLFIACVPCVFCALTATHRTARTIPPTHFPIPYQMNYPPQVYTFSDPWPSPYTSAVHQERLSSTGAIPPDTAEGVPSNCSIVNMTKAATSLLNSFLKWSKHKLPILQLQSTSFHYLTTPQSMIPTTSMQIRLISITRFAVPPASKQTPTDVWIFQTATFRAFPQWQCTCLLLLIFAFFM